MMNDRFSVQLRQHLVLTANERPAAGQLAAVIEQVEATVQRVPLMARLTWYPGRIGPFSSSALRYGLVALALIGALLAVVVFGGGSTPKPATIFQGTWFSIDPGDRSAQTLTVAAGTTPAVHFQDNFATGGACRDDAVKVFTADGIGQISLSHLEVSYPDGGGCSLNKVPIAGAYDYDEATDTLIDHDGLTWFRVQESGVAPTSIPTPDEFIDIPTPDPMCLDLDGGGEYTASVGSLSLTATLPADTSWEGRRDRFFLSRIGCPSPDLVWIDARVVTQVAPDACDRSASGVEIDSAAAATAALAAQTGVAVYGPTEVTFDGHPGSQLQLFVPVRVDASQCTDETLQPLDGVTIGPGDAITVDLVDVDGTTLAIVTNWGPDFADLRTQYDAIFSSLHVEP